MQAFGRNTLSKPHTAWMILPRSGWCMHCYASLWLTFRIWCHITRNLQYPSLFLVCLAYYWIPQWYLCIIPLFVKMVLRWLWVMFWTNSHLDTAPFTQHIWLTLELTLRQSSVLVQLCWTYLTLVYVSTNLRITSVILRLLILVINLWLACQDVLCSLWATHWHCLWVMYPRIVLGFWCI